MLTQIIDKKMIQDYFKGEKRGYLGASSIGDECARRIQYQLWHKKHQIKASTIRTFNIGHVLEDLVAKWLIDVGFGLQTRNAENKQFGFSTADGKFSGHVDGLIFSCSPDLEEALGVKDCPLPWLWETKTMNAKSWKETQKAGVFATKYQYYVQVQVYMAYLDLDCCLFTALNKDTSELYFETIKLDAEIAQRYSDRAVEIIKATENNELLPRIAKDPNFFICKMCKYHEECWNYDEEEK